MVEYVLNVFMYPNKQDISIRFSVNEDLTLGRLQYLIILLVSHSFPKWNDINKNSFSFQVGSYEFQHICEENCNDSIRNFVAFIKEPIPIKVTRISDASLGIVKPSHSRCCVLQ